MIYLPEGVAEERSGIALRAVHAAFKSIADSLGGCGFEVTGDVAPEEVVSILRTFEGYVDTLALNNPEIAKLNDEEESHG